MDPLVVLHVTIACHECLSVLHPSASCIFAVITQQRFLIHCHFLSFCSLYPHMFSRAYINFKNQEDIVLFRDRFDGYVFVDHKGK